jgi:hypothetical protein
MAVTADNIRTIIYDLKYSWWFRIWALLFLIGGIFTFVALIVLGAKSAKSGQEDDFHLWLENATMLSFPRFHFRIGGDSVGVTFNAGQSCTHNGVQLQFSSCQAWQGVVPPATTCFAVNSDTVYANNVANAAPNDNRIICQFNTTGFVTEEDLLVAWELEGANYADGGNAYASVWIAPNDNAWVMLYPNKLSMKHKTYSEWYRNLVYHSTVSTPGSYAVTVYLGSFIVPHVEAGNTYTGWMAMGEVGGFAFFFVILSTIVMALFGICLNNNSKFLGGDAE